MSNTKKNTTVTATVNTATITEANKNTTTTFSDDRGDGAEDPGHPETFTSSVDKDKNIYWTGAADNGTTEVAITGIAVKSGSDIMKNIKQDPNNSLNWQAKIKKDATIGTTQSYSITFKINNDASKVFTIDPKIKVKE